MYFNYFCVFYVFGMALLGCGMQKMLRQNVLLSAGIVSILSRKPFGFSLILWSR